jgi:hypothetical protein
MSTDWHALMEHLEEIQRLCHVDRPSMATRAHQIFLITAEVDYHLKVGSKKIRLRLIDLAQGAKESINSRDAQQRHVLVAEAVMKIHSVKSCGECENISCRS